jgi:hypothetical protein
MDVEVAEERGGLLDRGAAEGLDGLFELLGGGGAGLGVVDVGGVVDAQGSRLWSGGGDPATRGRAAGVVPMSDVAGS